MQQIWWEQIPSARQFAADVIDNLVNEKSVLIHHTESLPWRDTFLSLVKETVKQRNSSKTFETISDIADPGAYLLKEFCKPETRALFRPAKGYADFLAACDSIVLHDRYLWVEIRTPEQLQAWMSFVSDYVQKRDKKKEPAVFILEWHGIIPAFRKKGVFQLSFDHNISEYDRTLYAMLAVSSVKENVFLKNYLAELICTVIGDDVELYATCMEQNRAFMHDPYEVAVRCAQESRRSDGSDFAFRKTKEQVHHAIWLAQIRTVYPVIEEFRGRFVQKYQKSIRMQLPIASSYGTVYEDPKDVELGALVYMTDNGKLPLHAEEHQKLEAFKDARNTLSHLGVLTLEDLEYIHQ